MIIYATAPQKTEGGQREITVSDDNAQGLLNQLLKEMKKLNIHMSILSDEEIENKEIN